MIDSPKIPAIPTKYHNLILDTNGEFIATCNPYFIYQNGDKCEASFKNRFSSNNPFIFGIDSVLNDHIAEIRSAQGITFKLSTQMQDCEEKFNEFKKFVYCNSQDALVVLSNQEQLSRIICKTRSMHPRKVLLKSANNILKIIFEGVHNTVKPKNNRSADGISNVWEFQYILSKSMTQSFEIRIEPSNFKALWNDNFTIRICKSGLIEFISPEYNCRLYIKGRLLPPKEPILVDDDDLRFFGSLKS